MDVRLLKYFVILSEELNYRKAAERLFITQPTLSQQIKQLEADLGVHLISRTGNQIQLTQEGLMLRTEGYRILKELAALDIKVSSFHELRKQELQIGVSGMNLIIHPIETFAAVYPYIKLQIFEHSFDTIYQGVMEGRFAFGLSYNNEIPNHNLIREVMGYDQFECIVPIGHPLAKQATVTIKELEHESLILAQEKLSARKLLTQYENQHGIKLIPRYELPNYTSCLDLVQRSLGLSILPESFLNNHRSENVARLGLEDFSQQREISLLYKRDHAFTTYEEAFLACVRSAFQ